MDARLTVLSSAMPDRAASLGQELLRLRLECGLSLRKLARLLGMTAHSGLVDYERGIRIPPKDLMNSYVRIFHPHGDHLVALHRGALSERASLKVAATVAAPVTTTVPSPPRQPAEHAMLAGIMAEALEHAARVLREAAEVLHRE